MAIVVKGLMDVGGSNEGKKERAFSVTYNSIATHNPIIDTEVLVSAAVVAASGITIGSPWKNDSLSYCKSIRSKVLKRRDNPTSPTWEWTTTLEFATVRWPKITMRTEQFEWPATEDIIDHRAVTNSAGDRVLRTKKRSRIIFRWERYMASWNWLANLDAEDGGFRYTRNEGFWTPFGSYYNGLMENITLEPGKAMIQDITAEPVWDFGGAVLVSMEVHVDKDEFKDKFIDEGFFGFDGGTIYVPGRGSVPDINNPQRRQRFTDGAGFATRPVLLNGAGARQPSGARPPTVDQVFQYYPLADWNDSKMNSFFG